MSLEATVLKDPDPREGQASGSNIGEITPGRQSVVEIFNSCRRHTAYTEVLNAGPDTCTPQAACLSQHPSRWKCGGKQVGTGLVNTRLPSPAPHHAQVSS